MATINWGEDLQNFFNIDLAKMITNLFKFPATCLKRINEECKVKSVVAPLIMLVLGYIVTTLMNLIMGVPFGYAAQMALAIVFFVVFICALTFVALSIKGKSDINLAFEHTTIHSLVFMLFYIAFALMCLISGESVSAVGRMDNAGFFAILILLCIVYGLAMGISCMRQLLCTTEGEGKESYGWWISPCIVVVSLVLAIIVTFQL